MFEWDDAKNAENVRKHGLNFEVAVRIFDGRTVTWIDDRYDYGEIREISLGTIDGLEVLVVVHTDRRGVMRVISARQANRKEKTRYEKAAL